MDGPSGTEGPTADLLVLRHRQSTWNVERRWAGQADPDLSSKGVQEAERMATVLALLDVDAVVSSDLRRARRTAEIVPAAQPGARFLTDPRLRELDSPQWSGLTREQIEARILAGLSAAADHGRRTLVVTHAGAMRVLLTALSSHPTASPAGPGGSG